MPEHVRPSTVLPALRAPFTFTTSDGLRLIGEIARPESGDQSTGILCLHPNPAGGGMMDSHILKKAANRLPAMAGLTVIRFNTRGTSSEQGTSEGTYGAAITEKEDVIAAIEYSFSELKMKELWVLGWSFGTDLALKFARDSRIRGLILLSPPLRFSEPEDLIFWAKDGRHVIALVPEFDDYLKPAEARESFKAIPQTELIAVDGAKHLWVGEPFVYRVLSEIVRAIKPERLPLPTEI